MQEARGKRKILFLAFCFLLLALGFIFIKDAPYTAKSPEIDGMVYIPEGEFKMGSKGKLEHGYDGGDGRVGLDVGVDEIPVHSVMVKGFYIDRYEVANAQYKRFIDETKRKFPVDSVAPDAPYNWRDGNYPSGEGNHPVVNVTWFDAEAYCKWAGKRLPTEAEWEKSCRGSDGRRWSFGNSFITSFVNTHELDLKWSQAAGSFPEDRSPYGVYDMSGNVSEWTASWYNPYPTSTLKRETFGEQNKAIRGGAWLTSYLTARCAGRSFAVPEKKHRTLGFRCAKDKE
jgi:formylglycine-generating enzyme required for sulfatase activity